MKLEFFLNILKFVNFKFITHISYFWNNFSNIWLYLSKVEYLFIICKLLKKHMFLRFTILTDCCVIDRPFSIYRYEIIYNLLSITFNIRIFLKIFLLENIFIQSLNKIFLNSNWIEREIWDMFGIIFIYHNDLRRILSDYSFEGHPLRKDFPLTGFVELQYDDKLLSLKYVPIELAQDYRIFTFLSPWEEIAF